MAPPVHSRVRCDKFLLPSHGANLPELLKDVPRDSCTPWPGGCMAKGTACAASSGCRGSAGPWHPKLCLAQAKLTTQLSTLQLHRAVLGLPTFSCAAGRVQKVILPTAVHLQAILPVGQGCEG